MKTTIKTTTFLACLFFIIFNVQAANDFKSKQTLQKTFTSASNSTLLVENEYGTINIHEWDKNEVSFEVVITATAKSQADADKIVKSVNVNFSQTGSIIAAKTSYENLKNCNCSRSVDYQIMVPKSIHYQLKNEYGNIAMENAKGNLSVKLEYGNMTGLNFSGSDNSIDIEYGNMNIGQLTGNNNMIKVSYGGDLSVSTGNKLMVKLEYSKLKIGTITDMDIKSEYSDVSIQKVKTLNIKSEYENYNIGEIDALTGKSEYTNFSIKQLSKSLVLMSEYGKLDVQNISPQFESMDIKSSYTPIDIKIDATASYSVDAVTEYGKITLPSTKNNVTTISKDSRESVKGIIGTSTSPKASVKIKTEYAPIKIK